MHFRTGGNDATRIRSVLWSDVSPAQVVMFPAYSWVHCPGLRISTCYAAIEGITGIDFGVGFQHRLVSISTLLVPPDGSVDHLRRHRLRTRNQLQLLREKSRESQVRATMALHAGPVSRLHQRRDLAAVHVILDRHPKT
jgi:hypothetical protein